MGEMETLWSQFGETINTHEQIRLFALTSLSADNPFRPKIEEHVRESIDRIRRTMESLEGSKENGSPLR